MAAPPAAFAAGGGFINRFRNISSSGQKLKQHQNCQKGKIEGREQQHIVAGFALVLLSILPEGDQACQGRDQSAHAADVHAQEQISVIVRELGQKDGRGHVADDLAGKYAEQQGAFLQKH